MYRRLLLEVEESPLLPGALHTKVVLLPTLPLAPPPAGMFIFIDAHCIAMNKNPTSLKDLKTCRQGRPLGWQGQLLRHRHPAAQPTRLEHIGQDWSDIVKLKISTDVAVCSLCERSTRWPEWVKNYERSDTAQLLWIPNFLTYRSFYLSVNAIKPGIFQKLVKLHSILCNNTWHLFISSGEAPWVFFLMADINSCKLGRGLLLHEGTVPASTGVMRGPGSLTQGSPGSPSMAAMADCGGDRRALWRAAGWRPRRSNPHLRHARLIPSPTNQPWRHPS